MSSCIKCNKRNINHINNSISYNNAIFAMNCIDCGFDMGDICGECMGADYYEHNKICKSCKRKKQIDKLINYDRT